MSSSSPSASSSLSMLTPGAASVIPPSLHPIIASRSHRSLFPRRSTPPCTSSPHRSNTHARPFDSLTFATHAGQSSSASASSSLPVSTQGSTTPTSPLVSLHNTVHSLLFLSSHHCTFSVVSLITVHSLLFLSSLCILRHRRDRRHLLFLSSSSQPVLTLHYSIICP
jgi:hypothetical protein